MIGVVVGCIIVYMLYGLRPEPQLEQKDEGGPQTTVYLRPYDNFTQKEAERLKAELDKHLVDILDEAFRVVVLPNKPLSDSFLGETKTKYRIDKVIADMKGNADKHNIYVGVTHRDICMRNKNGVKGSIIKVICGRWQLMSSSTRIMPILIARRTVRIA